MAPHDTPMGTRSVKYISSFWTEGTVKPKATDLSGFTNVDWPTVPDVLLELPLLPLSSLSPPSSSESFARTGFTSKARNPRISYHPMQYAPRTSMNR